MQPLVEKPLKRGRQYRRHSREAKQRCRKDKEREQRQFDLPRFDLLAAILGCAANHQTGDEHASNAMRTMVARPEPMLPGRISPSFIKILISLALPRGNPKHNEKALISLVF